MDPAIRKTVLRMLPCGVYVVTSGSGPGDVAAAAIHWVMQTSFEPPLVTLALRPQGELARLTRSTGYLAINVLGRQQAEVACAFYRGFTHDDERIAGERYSAGVTGAPLLDTSLASLEARLVECVERGDHHLFVVEVVAVTLRQAIEGRPDAAILQPGHLGDGVFYGG